MHPAGRERVRIDRRDREASKRRRSPGRGEELKQPGSARALVVEVAEIRRLATRFSLQLGAMAIDHAGEPDRLSDRALRERETFPAVSLPFHEAPTGQPPRRKAAAVRKRRAGTLAERTSIPDSASGPIA